MEQFSDGLKTVVKAGFGAVAMGVEKTQEVIKNLSQKGEPLFEQAKDAVNDAAEMIKKAVDDSGIGDAFSCRPQVQSIISDLQQLKREELEEIREALAELIALKEQPGGEAEEAVQPETPQEPEQPAPVDENDPER